MDSAASCTGFLSAMVRAWNTDGVALRIDADLIVGVGVRAMFRSMSSVLGSKVWRNEGSGRCRSADCSSI